MAGGQRNPGTAAGRFRRRLLVVGAIVAVIVAVAATLTPRGLNDWDEARLLPAGLLTVLVVLRLAASPRSLSSLGGQAGIWLAIVAVLALGWSYRDEINGLTGRAAATFVPGRAAEVAPGVLRFTADDQGQFYADAEANGVGVHFLIDTGASGVTLSRRDAARLGFHPDDDSFTGFFSTANGMVRAAPVTLDRLALGPFELTRVAAWVNRGKLDTSLMGMSFLKTLGRIEIEGDTLTIERAP